MHTASRARWAAHYWPAAVAFQRLRRDGRKCVGYFCGRPSVARMSELILDGEASDSQLEALLAEALLDTLTHRRCSNNEGVRTADVEGAVSNIETLTPTDKMRATTARVDVKMRRPSALLLATAATAAAFSHPPLLKPLEKFQRVPPPQLRQRARISDTAGPHRAPRAALAGLGLVETGAIAADKLSGSESLSTLCSASGGGCSDVLNGPWASVAGVLLALFGAAATLPSPCSLHRSCRAIRRRPTRRHSLLFGSAALATFLRLPGWCCSSSSSSSRARFAFGSAAISAAIGLVAWNTPSSATAPRRR